MSGPLNLRRNVTSNVLAFFLNIVLTFASYRLVVHQGGLETLGLWSALTAAIYLIRMGDVGMGSATERQIAALDPARTPEAARGYLDTGLALNTALFGVLAVAGYLLLAPAIGRIVSDPAHQAEALSTLPVMLLGFVLSNVAGIVIAGLRGMQLAWIAAWISIAGAIVQLVAVLIFVPLYGLVGLAWAQALQFLVMGLAAWVIFGQRLAAQSGTVQSWLPRFASRTFLREMFGFSLRAQAVNLLNGMFEPAAKLLVGQTGGLAVLGLFEMAWKIVALPRNAVVAGVHGTTPAMTRLLTSAPDEARALYVKSRRLVTRASAVVLALVVLGAPLASLLILGRLDGMLWVFVALLAIGFLGNVLGAPAYTLGFAAGRLRGNMLSSALVLAALWPLDRLGGLLIAPGLRETVPVAVSAFLLAAGGLLVRFCNQKLVMVNRVPE